MENEQLKIPGVESEKVEPVADPILEFVVEGVKLSLSQNRMTREQAEECVRRWYPESRIILEDD